MEIHVQEIMAVRKIYKNLNFNANFKKFLGALYQYNTAVDAKVYGILSHAPNIKKPSTCSDSHNTFVSVITMAIKTWIEGIITANP